MQTRIRRWGNSQGVRLPRAILAEVGLTTGDAVDLRVEHGTLVVTPARGRRGRFRLEDLVAGIPEGEYAEEADWGASAGEGVG